MVKFKQPRGISVDSNHFVYVSVASTGFAQKIDTDGNIYVANTGSNGIEKLNGDGTP